MFKFETIQVKSGEKAARELIKAQGKYRAIGSGCYGVVFGSKASDVVYKMGDVGENDGYLAYLKALSTQKKHNPFTPKIYGVRIYKGKKDSWGCSDSYFVVAMEKLSTGKGLGHVASWFEETLGGYDNIETTAFGLLGIVMPQALKDAIKLLKAAHRSSNSDWDLHGGNFMYRGKQVVVTDPLC